ncbi:hypothetical protein D1872_247920 [compost metagenome]
MISLRYPCLRIRAYLAAPRASLSSEAGIPRSWATALGTSLTPEASSLPLTLRVIDAPLPLWMFTSTLTTSPVEAFSSSTVTRAEGDPLLIRESLEPPRTL